MAKKAKIEIIGITKLNRLLRLLPDTVDSKLIFSALSESGRIITRFVKAHVPGGTYKNRTYNLMNSIGIKRGKYKKFPAVFAGVRVGKKRKYDGWYAHFIEFGTSGLGKRTKRDWSTKKGKGLEYSRSGKAGNAGIKATHFFEKSSTQKVDEAIKSIHGNLSKKVTKYLKKYAPRQMK